jgi:deoxyadenosine/deoxycytidine kinase
MSNSTKEINNLIASARLALKNRVIAIETGIGAGKTSLCQLLEQTLSGDNFDVKVMYENVPKEWLNEYISNMDDNAIDFQTKIYKKRVNQLIEAHQYTKNTNGIAILDRSIGIGDPAFMQMQKQIYSRFTDTDINSIKNSINVDQLPDIDILIYLRINADTSIRRVRKRNRPGEVDGYSKDYLSNVIDMHEYVIKRDCPQNLICLDWNEDSELTDDKLIATVLTQLINFVQG